MRQSILDRLIQVKEPPRSAAKAGPATGTRREQWKESVERLKASVLRDLEWLLNTRETGDPASAPWTEVERSIYNYGLPDFASLSAESSRSAARLLKAIEREIELFEPRLANVSVSFQEGGPGEERRMKFVIQGTLLLDPDPEHVEFDSVLELDNGQFSLTREV